MIRSAYYFLIRSGIAVPLIFLGLMFWLDPFSDVAAFDNDEGVNLMKALLIGRGYRLYVDIWNDQPPVLTILLARWFDLFGQAVQPARILIAIFASILLWGFYWVGHRWVSAISVVTAVVLLILSQFFLRLSGAVMIGLPALSIAVLSVSILVVWNRHTWLVALSGALMALALQTKFLAVLVVPAAALHLVLVADAVAVWPDRTRWRLLAVWLGSMVAVFFLVVALFERVFDINMLIGSHFKARTSFSPADENIRIFLEFTQLHAAYLAVAIVGVVFAYRQRSPGVILPLTWFVTAAIVMSVHQPIRYHYVLLLTIPLCWLCAYGIEAWVSAFRGLVQENSGYGARRLVRGLGLAIGAGIFVASILYYPEGLKERLEFQSQIYRPLYDWGFVQHLREESRAKPGFVFTERAFYAFQAGQPVPPSIAVFTRTRMQAMTDDQFMIDALVDYTPEYVILEKFSGKISQGVWDEIAQHYELMQENDTGLFYVRKSE